MVKDCLLGSDALFRDSEVGEGGGGRSLSSQTDEASGAGEKERKGLHGRVVKCAFR